MDYQFIDEAGIDVYVDQNKVNLFRVAFLLERLCPVETGLGATFSETVSPLIDKLSWFSPNHPTALLRD